MLFCLALLAAAPAPAPYPPCAAVVDVTKPPYSAKGDGVADDTAALQRALSDLMGQHKVLYLPDGTYLITKTLTYTKKDSRGGEAWGFTFVRGQSRAGAVIRLKDATFTDPAKPQAMLFGGGFGSADWFHNYLEDLTFDVGRGNPGAIGVQFYSNNTGAVRNVAIVSRDGQGVAGLDLAARDMNGPLLVQDLAVTGFATGVSTGARVNSQTFERLTLTGQSKTGLANFGQSISVRKLAVSGAPVAVDAKAFTVLLDGTFTGPKAAGPAVVVGDELFFARGLTATGFAAVSPRVKPAGGEYAQGTGANPFAGPTASLDLPVEEPPAPPADAPKLWANVDAFGADPTGNRDSSDAVQKAIDSGASTVFFPGAYNLTKPVRVRGKAARLVGVGNWLDYKTNSKPDLIIEDGAAPAVTLEHFQDINGGVEVRTDRTVVFKSVGVRTVKFFGKGKVFFEDVTTNDLRFRPGMRVWARQLNVENEGTHVTNDGATLWVLGYKTERGGTLLHTLNGGASEVLGNLSYTTTAGKLAPMFVTEDARAWAFFNEVCYSGDPFTTLVRETRGPLTKTVPRDGAGLAPYAGRK